MAWCLIAPTHYMIQYCLITSIHHHDGYYHNLLWCSTGKYILQITVTFPQVKELNVAKSNLNKCHNHRHGDHCSDKSIGDKTCNLQQHNSQFDWLRIQKKSINFLKSVLWIQSIPKMLYCDKISKKFSTNTNINTNNLMLQQHTLLSVLPCF